MEHTHTLGCHSAPHTTSYQSPQHPGCACAVRRSDGREMEMEEDRGQKHLRVRAACAAVGLRVKPRPGQAFAPGAAARAAACPVAPGLSHGQTSLVTTDHTSLVRPGRICF